MYTLQMPVKADLQLKLTGLVQSSTASWYSRYIHQMNWV